MKKNVALVEHGKLLGKRLSTIIALRDFDSLTFKAVGEKIGCGAPRAAQLYHNAKWLQSWHHQGEAGDPLYGLSSRAANVCANAGLMNRKQVMEAVKSGLLHPRNGLSNFRNYGWKSHVEVHKWLGLEEPRRPFTKRTVCPHCGKSLR